MNVSRNPSYLYQSRHGIYYFRARIPLSIKSRYSSTKSEVRKSLNTRSVVVARKEARRLWVLMEDSDYMMNMDELERQQQEANEGRQLLKRFLIAAINSRETDILDGEDVDNFFVDDVNENTASETHILFTELNSYQEELLKRQLDLWGEEPKEKKKAILLKLREEVEQEQVVDSKIGTIQKQVVDLEEVGVGVSKDKLLVDAVSEFIEDGKATKSRGDAKGWAKTTIQSYVGILNEFVRIVGGGDVLCSSINRDTIVAYDSNIWKVPVGLCKKKIYKAMSVSQTIEYAKNHGVKSKSNETIKNHVMRVRELLKWLATEGYIEDNLDRFLKEVPKSDKRDDQKRGSFTDDELVMLFENDIYENGRYSLVASHKDYGSSIYWLPLISVFTGMRGEEIAQLYNDDIQYDEKAKVWFIEVRYNEERRQTAKTGNSSRKIPMHPILKRLGLVGYAQSIKGAGMLFPDCYHKSGNYYKNWGNNFNRKSGAGWKWKLGIKREGAVFHSLRHNFMNVLELKGIEEKHIAAIVGHGYIGDLVPNYRVNKDKMMGMLYEYVKMVEYPFIKWSKIKKLRRW